MADRRWKRRERQIATLLGTNRLPSNGHAQSDIHAAIGGVAVAIEHKSRESIPAWLADAVSQAVRNAPADHLPIVVLSAGAGAGKPLHRLAVIRLDDLPALLTDYRSTHAEEA